VVGRFALACTLHSFKYTTQIVSSTRLRALLHKPVGTEPASVSGQLTESTLRTRRVSARFVGLTNDVHRFPGSTVSSNLASVKGK